MCHRQDILRLGIDFDNLLRKSLATTLCSSWDGIDTHVDALDGVCFPITGLISHGQLTAEVKDIDAGLVMVEAMCIDMNGVPAEDKEYQMSAASIGKR